MQIQSFICPSGTEPGEVELHHEAFITGEAQVASRGGAPGWVGLNGSPWLVVLDSASGEPPRGPRGPRIPRPEDDAFCLQLLCSGRFRGGRAGEERPLSPGDVILFDRSRPRRARGEEAQFVTVTLARDIVEAVLPDAHRFHGTVLAAASVGLLADLMTSLARRAGSLAPEAARHASRALAELLAAALETPAAPADAAATDPRRQRAETFIEAHLHDPRLDPERIAEALGLSRTTLYGLFAHSGGVARHIQARRLERLRSALGRASETRSVTTLTYDHGFTSESHCSRAFRAAYGMPPGRYRSEMERLRFGRRA